MSTTLTIELSDELEQHLIAQAEQLNMPIEKVVLSSLNQSINLVTKPATQTQANYIQIAEMLMQIREAQQSRQSTALIPANPLTLNLATQMQEMGFIGNITQTETDNKSLLEITLNPENGDRPTLTVLDEINAFMAEHSIAEGLSPELIPLLNDLKHPDPVVRSSAIQALGTRYHESTQSL
jgi:hypothetical protein